MSSKFFWITVCLVVAFAFSSVAMAFDADRRNASVTIPIERFLELNKLEEATPLTVIEDVTFSGAYGKSLQVSVSGSSNGKPQAVEFIDRSGDFNLHDCSGNALLHAAGSRLAVLPQGQRFKLSCQIEVRSWSQIEFQVVNALYVRSKVEGGEAIQDGNETLHRLTLTKVNREMNDENAEVAAVARYRISIQPEETRFEYQFVLSNPSRNKRKFQVPFTNGEIVQNTKAVIEYSEAKAGMDFVLVPGENRISLSGRYSAEGFKAPLAKAQSFLLVETHPMLQAKIESAARRISPQDASLSPRFPAARAYFLGASDAISWKTKKLETFSTLGYSVSSASYLFYTPKSGQNLVEASFTFNNQGMPEIPLEVPGRATYLEIAGVPQVLSKDDKGRLLLQLPTGYQSVLVQYETPAEVGGLFASVSEMFARPASVMSNVNVALALDDRWQVLAGASLSGFKSDWSTKDFAFALFGFLVFMKLLSVAKIDGVTRWLVAGAFGLLFAIVPEVFTLVATAVVVALLIRHRGWFIERRPKTIWSWVGTVVAAGFVFILTVTLLSPKFQNVGSGMSRSYEGQIAQKLSAATSNSMPKSESLAGAGGRGDGMEDELAMDEAPMPPPSAAPSGSTGIGDSEQGEFQGLPARVSIPTDARQLAFHQGLMDEKTHPRMFFVLISKSVGGFFLFLLVGFFGWTAYRHRRELLAFLRLDLHEEKAQRPRAAA
ncbi:MAG: hypothetical protein AAB250_14255 [Bdellovibrionota bacterium]